MGWSCTAAAARTLALWREYCERQTGNNNVFRVGKDEFFIEEDRIEHRDGHVSGSIMKMIGKTRCREDSKFYINPDGTVRRAPKVLSNLMEP